MSLNKVLLIGFVGKDPEIRYAQSGLPIIHLSLATSDNKKTEWHKLVIINEKLARVAQQYVKKGTQLYIEGKIQTQCYENKENVKVYSTEILVNNLQMLGAKQSSEEGSSQPASAAPEDDIPF